jgi:hypothetical protein
MTGGVNDMVKTAFCLPLESADATVRWGGFREAIGASLRTDSQ